MVAYSAVPVLLLLGPIAPHIAAIRIRENLDVEAMPNGIMLPSYATWCEVRPCDGNPPIKMAVYSSNDIVSKTVCSSGQWEMCNAKQYFLNHSSNGSPQRPLMLDIGSNLGYYALLFANAGFDVVAVEPMQQNTELIEATLQANPRLREHVHLHKVGLGAIAGDQCTVMAETINVGDGNVYCSPEPNDMSEWIEKKKTDGLGYDIKGQFTVTTLDDLLEKEPFVQRNPSPKFDYFKMDVEGNEGMVMKGGMSLLKTFTPKRIQSEVWEHMQGSSPDEFLHIFEDAGYNVGKQFQCSTQLAGGHIVVHDPPIVDLKMCRSETTSSLLQLGQGQDAFITRHGMMRATVNFFQA